MKVLITGAADFGSGVTSAAQALACTETGRKAAEYDNHGARA